MKNGTANRAPANATLTLTMLGGASLSYLLPSQDLTQVLGPGKPLALLAYLSRLPKKTATRDHVLDLLWSNQEPALAKPALRQAIWYIRQRIGSTGIQSGEGILRLAVPVDSDVERFETAVNTGDLERAVELYVGPFLPDLAIPGGAEFEHWAHGERTRLEALFLRTAEIVVRSWLAQGQFQKAERLARRIRDMNRVRQAWWRLLLEVLTSSGDSVRAAVEAGELERALAEEGLTPDQATSEAIRLAKQMPATTPTAPAGRALVAELVGREREFATVIRAWEAAKGGTGNHLTVTAGAGLGKTRLLNDVHMRLHASGVQIVHLRANVGERKIDYSLASSLAAALSSLPGAMGVPPACASTLVALNQSLSTTFNVNPASIKDSDVLRMRTTALCELLTSVAHEQPIAVLIDDLHWVDEASRNLLGGIAGCLREHAALMITASRPTARGPLQDSAAEEINLQPLSLENIAALVSSIGALPDDEWVRPALQLLRDENGGSPLLILESLQLALDRGSLNLNERTWSCPDREALLSELKQGGALRHRVAKLDRSESWILLVLAVAGMPLSVNRLVRMTRRSEATLSVSLATLEQRGFISRVNDEVEPTHDEIGALAVELAPQDAITAARGAAGRVLAQDASDNDQLLLHAGQLLASASDRSRLNEVFRNYLWISRARGDRRPARELAREMLGNRKSADESKALYRSLPLYYRAGLTSTQRIAAAVTVVLIMGAVFVVGWLWPDGTPPDIVLIAYDRTSGPFGHPIGANVMRDRLTSFDAIELNRTNDAPRIDSIHGQPVSSPDGNSWAFNRLKSDSGEIDIFIIDSEGNERRLTHTPNDDGVLDWSPDGRHLAIVSSRWHTSEFYEVATLEVATGEVTRLTDSPENESQVRWSPDGTRIGFLRTRPGSYNADFCWTTPKADPPVCVRETSWFSGWDGPNNVLVALDSTGTRWFGRLNLEDGRFQPIVPWGTFVRLYNSRDGAWILGLYRDSVSGRSAWKLFPTDAPNIAREVLLPTGNTDGFVMALKPTRPQFQYLERLAIDSLSTALPLGIPMLLNASGFDAIGNSLPLRNVAWGVHGPAVAEVDPRGVLRPRQAGITLIRATAGGWRKDSARIEVADVAAAEVFAEAWSEDWNVRWDAYGDPMPLVTVGPDSVDAFWNNSDVSFTSGAFTQQMWPANSGLFVEAWISTTITDPIQQTMSLSFAGWMDPEAISDWNHTEGYVPGRSSDSRPEHCAIAYPNKNEVQTGEVSLQVGRGIDFYNTGMTFHTGEWHRVLVQIFPDGTCGIAVNGRAIARSTTRVPLDHQYRLWTEGRSTGSEMLVGPLEIWTGVQAGVDWSALDWPG